MVRGCKNDGWLSGDGVDAMVLKGLGELIYVPEKWAPFDVIFLYFLPVLPFELDQIFVALAKHCSLESTRNSSYEKMQEQLKQLKEVNRNLRKEIRGLLVCCNCSNMVYATCLVNCIISLD